MLKVGDILISKTECIMYGTNFRSLRIGKEYRIKVIDKNLYGSYQFNILDEGGDLHSFPFSKYDEYFYTIKEIRKMKLERLGVC